MHNKLYLQANQLGINLENIYHANDNLWFAMSSKILTFVLNYEVRFYPQKTSLEQDSNIIRLQK